MNLTIERLKQVYGYNADTGVFTRLISTGNRFNNKVGNSGYIQAQGYWMISLDGTQYRAHRLAWFYVHGVWPENDIDHIDGDRLNNRLVNLREATRAENMQNIQKANSNNKTGLLGAYWCKRDKKFIAKIKSNGVNRVIGYFNTAELAHSAYIDAKRHIHPFSTI